MNRFDEKYDIRLAGLSDIDDIMTFIAECWKKDHILACDRDFFLYEHVDGEEVHFLIAKRREDARLDAVLGYIPASRDKSRLDIWTALWKAREGAMLMLGMELYKRIGEMTGARSVIGLGDSPRTTVRLLNTFTNDFRTWKMSHYYLLSDRDDNDYRIAQVHGRSRKKQSDGVTGSKTEMREFKTPEEMKEGVDFSSIDKQVPYKDVWYLTHRYFTHPYYSYRIYGLFARESAEAIVVTRVEEYNGSKALRIVDFLGDQKLFGGTGNAWKDIMKQEQYEYIDFYVHGFDHQMIGSAGFEETGDDAVIIPDHFHPFVCENIDIWCSANVENPLICKADGDQDRPV